MVVTLSYINGKAIGAGHSIGWRRFPDLGALRGQ